MITHVYFDWSRTLAKSHSAKTKQTMKKYRCKILYPDVKLMCKYLYEAGSWEDEVCEKIYRLVIHCPDIYKGNSAIIKVLEKK